MAVSWRVGGDGGGPGGNVWAAAIENPLRLRLDAADTGNTIQPSSDLAVYEIVASVEMSCMNSDPKQFCAHHGLGP